MAEGIDATELGRLLYSRALVRSDDEPITDPRGQQIGWLLDTRIPMMEGEIFRAVGTVLAQRLESRRAAQVAGYGYGAFPIVCSALSSSQARLRGGFIRSARKPHGRRRRVEGPIETSTPVVLVDDILNSGRSASQAILILNDEGFRVEGCLTLFNFLWGGGRKRLERAGLWVESILDINLKDQTPEIESISDLST